VVAHALAFDAMNRPSPIAEVNVETLKLLLQVAWADDQLDPKEREAVAKIGPQWGVPEETMAMLLKHLDMGKPLPQPNLALLRQHRDVVIAAAEWFVSVDGVIEETEVEFLATVSEMLGH
jgi:tellurite resistance protein